MTRPSLPQPDDTSSTGSMCVNEGEVLEIENRTLNPTEISNGEGCRVKRTPSGEFDDLITVAEFGGIKEEIHATVRKTGKRTVGDWRVEVLNDMEVKVSVGGGEMSTSGDVFLGRGSQLRKISYLQPDVCAMLR